MYNNDVGKRFMKLQHLVMKFLSQQSNAMGGRRNGWAVCEVSCMGG
jgi:hypothetical protein